MDTLVIVVAAVLAVGLLVESIPPGWRKALGALIILIGLLAGSLDP